MPYAANGIISQSPLDGGIEISEAQYGATLGDILSGKEVAVIAGDLVVRPPAPTPEHAWENGEWVAPPEPEPTPENLWEIFRLQRNARLRESDWVILRNLETNEPVPEAWLIYRQALRDLPETTADPANPDWPVAPDLH